MKRLLALLLLLSLVVVSHARATTVDEYCVTARDAQIVSLVNDYRQQNGLPRLPMSQTLGAAAHHHALDMALTGDLTHVLSDGTTWLQNIINHGYPFGYRTENIAWGYGGDPQRILSAWKASTSHNSAMLNAGFGAIGVKQVYNASAPYQYFTVTTFGSALDTPALLCSGPAPTATTTPAPTRTPTTTPTATNTPSATSVPAETMTVTVEPTKPGRGRHKRTPTVTP